MCLSIYSLVYDTLAGWSGIADIEKEGDSGKEEKEEPSFWGN